MKTKIESYANRVLHGNLLNFDEGMELINTPREDLLFLFSWANQIRQKFRHPGVDLCSIYNGRSGKCSEDCFYCAQSAHYQTGVTVYPLVSEKHFLQAALQSEQDNSHRFSIVTSGPGGDNDQDFDALLEVYRKIRQETSLTLCASLGSMTTKKALALKEAGVSRYHHNIETSPTHYKNICTTHSFEERIETIKIVQEAGLEVCSGGILGLGESLEDRTQMALILRELRVDCVPLNILNPISGTPLQNQPPLKPFEYLRTLATFRFLLPKVGIRCAGGREKNVRDLQSMILLSGADGMMIGDYLTTSGRSVQEDWQMLQDLEMTLL